MQISPLKKADEVLRFLATSPFAKPFISLTDIIDRITTVSFKENNAIELIEILDKLERDIYVVSEVRRQHVNETAWDEGLQGQVTQEYVKDIRYFRITFEGRMFEGYEKQRERLNQNEEKVKLLEEKNRQLSKRTYILTFILAIGAIFQAIYYSIEIYTFYHHP